MMNQDLPCFEFDRVSFAWPGGPTILDRQSFTLPKGIFTLVRGPSGSGKSTLLRLMNRLEEPGAGTIRFDGRSLSEWSPPELRQQAAYLQQTPAIPDLSVREILLHPYAFRVNREKTPPEDAALKEMLSKVKMADVGLKDAGAALSGGQRQRLGILRALVTEPKVLLLDEPTASLDRDSKRCVEKMAEAACRKGATVVMISHDRYMPKHVPAAEITIDKGRVLLCR